MSVIETLRRFRGPRAFAALLFIIGLALAFLSLQYPVTREFFDGLEQDGYLGVFLAGILYAISVTAASATVIFANMHDTVSPFLAALVGGLGAFLYDLLIFLFTRRTARQRIEAYLAEKLPMRRRTPRWLTVLIGAIILASPLPDELAAGFLGVTRISIPRFFLLSFALNAIGIGVLLLL